MSVFVFVAIFFLFWAKMRKDPRVWVSVPRDKKIKIILLFNLFSLLFINFIVFFVLFIGFIVLFQLIFTFIYNNFNNKFSILQFQSF